MKLLVVSLVMLCVSCKHYDIESVTVKSWRVDTIWKKPIVGVDDQITPMRYLARLSNGDTVPVANTTRIGDSIQYKFIKLKESSK